MARQGAPGGPGRREHRGPVPEHLSGRRWRGHSVTAVVEAHALGKRYRRAQALTDCTLSIPAGRVAGLVGPNGAGKTTLLHLATGGVRGHSGRDAAVGPPALRPAVARRRPGSPAVDCRGAAAAPRALQPSL